MAMANRRSPPKRIASFHWLAIITCPFRLTEYHGVPTRFQLNFLLLHLAIPVSPVDLDGELDFERYEAESEMYVGASLPRMTVAAVNLSHQQPAIRQANFHNCADGAAARHIQSLYTATHSCRCCQIFIQWQAEAYAEEGSLARTLIEVKKRGGPLIGYGVI
jgi:hypothetical protein